LKAKNVKFKAQIASPNARQITPPALWLTAELFVIVIPDIKVKDVINVPMIKYAKMEVTALKIMIMANFGVNARQDLLVRGATLIFVIMFNVKTVELVFLHLMVHNANVLRTSKAIYVKTMPAKTIAYMGELPMGNYNPRDTINVIVTVLLVLLDCVAKKIHALPFNASMEAIVPSSEAVKYVIAH
jgi:hypothetical protein